MRIGIDIDGVLTDIEQFTIDYISKYCVENNIEYNIGNKSYDYSKTFNISKEIEMNFWNTYLEDYAIYEKARPFASEIIKKLKEDGHEIYIITARWLTNRDDDIGNKMREIVKNWLYENEISYDKLIFSKASKERKTDEIIENKIDLMIEDSPSNINELSNIVPVICYNAEYNKECIGEKIIRCYSWYDIYNKIKN
ncbi:MAG: hypothetical protein E7310_02235 [Clostridiales bacterium]|nr:hypothetical protein [Clostridiales bacterium]